MKIVYVVLFAFLMSGMGNAQAVVFDPNPVEVSATSDVWSVDSKFKTTSTSSTSWLWELDRTDAPAEWKFTVCDANLCYAPGVEMCAPDKPNIMSAGEVTEAPKVTLQPNGVEGLATVYLRTTDSATGNETGTLEITFDITGPSSIFTPSESNINIFPNPATEYFEINTSENLSLIHI